MKYVLSALVTIKPIGDGEHTIFNGANKKHEVKQLVTDILSLFSEPRTFDEVIQMSGGEEALRPLLETMAEQLFLVPVEFDDQQEMRKTWNCLAATSAEDAVFFIDNEAETLAQFDEAGKEGVAALQRWIAIGENERIANIGCGMGRLERHLGPLVKELWAFDVSDRMLERAREYLKGVDNVRLERTEGRLDVLPEGSMDKVISFLVFQHIPKAATWQYFREAARVLKPGGQFAFQILCYADEVGFEQSECSPLGRYYGAGKARYKEAEVLNELSSAGLRLMACRDGSYSGDERRLSGTGAGHWSSKLILAERE